MVWLFWYNVFSVQVNFFSWKCQIFTKFFSVYQEVWHVCVLSHVQHCDPMDCSLPVSLGLWHFPSKNTGVGSHFVLQGIFPIQGSNPCLLWLQHWQVGSLPLCHSQFFTTEALGIRHIHLWQYASYEELSVSLVTAPGCAHSFR